MADTLLATRLKKGMIIKLDNELFRIHDLMHVTPGNLRGFVRVKARNLRTQTMSEQKLRSEDVIERATLDEKEMQFLYSDGDGYHFMDTETYEQIHMTAETLGDSVGFLKPEMTIQVEFYGAEPVGIELPQTVDLKVVETVPGHQGRDGDQPDEARHARDRRRRAGAAVRRRRRRHSRQHGNGRISGRA